MIQNRTPALVTDVLIETKTSSDVVRIWDDLDGLGDYYPTDRYDNDASWRADDVDPCTAVTVRLPQSDIVDGTFDGSDFLDVEWQSWAIAVRFRDGHGNRWIKDARNTLKPDTSEEYVDSTGDNGPLPRALDSVDPIHVVAKESLGDCTDS